MPTSSDRARVERDQWAGIAARWTEESAPDPWRDRPPREKDVVIFHDPSEDLQVRAQRWGHALEDTDLASLAAFAAGLAEAEALGWETDAPDVATRSYEDRRFLLSDRIIHWAVPWLDGAGHGYPIFRDRAHADRDTLLDLGDDARVAPTLPGSEGLQASGEDSFGPVDPLGEPGWEESLWSGALLLTVELKHEDRARVFDAASARWTDLAEQHPGSAQLWHDLAARAKRSSARLKNG